VKKERFRSEILLGHKGAAVEVPFDPSMRWGIPAGPLWSGRRGHRVDIAQDVHSALKVTERDSFDLVISDVGLPDGTGADLMAKLRTTGVRGIAVSGFGMRADVERSLASGFAEHLVKPVSFEKLEAAIHRTMRAARELSAKSASSTPRLH
jgi:DNA-binding response OmpR family regulator